MSVPILAGDAGSDLVADAFERHQQGRTDEAEGLYREALRRRPYYPEALMLLGLLLTDSDDIEESEALLRRYLVHSPDDPVASHHIGRLRQRRDDHSGAIEWFKRAVARRPDHAPLLNDLGVSLHRIGEFAAALKTYGRAVELAPDSADLWFNLGYLHHDQDKFGPAEDAYRRALTLDADCGKAYIQLADLLEHAHRPEEAERMRVELARRDGVAVLASTGPDPIASILLIGGAGLCNMPPDHLFDRRRYTTISVYLLGPADADASQATLAERLPPFDLAFSIVADPDRAGPYLAAASALSSALDCPVLNPPDHRIERTRRDLLPALLADIPGLVAPRTWRATRDELVAMAAAAMPLDRPLLIRPCGSHGGEDLVRLASAADLDTYLDRVPLPLFYLSDYWDYRSADGYFRKYRLIFVDRAVYPYHLAISEDWLVHYYRTDMDTQAWMRREEARFMADYETVFTGEAARALRTVASRLDLDYAGIDCAILPDGRVLLFEANATMLVHLNDPPDLFPYKHSFVPRIFNAIDRLVEGSLRTGTADHGRQIAEITHA